MQWTIFLCDSCEYVKMTRNGAEHQAQVPKCQGFGNEVHTDASTLQVEALRALLAWDDAGIIVYDFY